MAKALKGHCDWWVRTPAPPSTLPGGKGMRLESSKVICQRLGGRRGGELGGHGCRSDGELRDEARGASFDAFALAGVAEADLRGGAEQAESDGAGELPIELRGGVGHGGFALDFERQERMGCAGGGPGGFAGAHEPDGVGGEAGGFGGAGDLDGGVAGLGGEEGFVEGAGEDGEKLGPADAAAVEAERGAGLDGLLPAAESLELDAGKGARAGPAGGFEKLGNEFGPFERALRLCVFVGEARWAAVIRAAQAGGNGVFGVRRGTR